MLHAIAVIIIVVSAALPAPTNPHALSCFNAQYPNVVTAEDSSVITCPAVYYAGH